MLKFSIDQIHFVHQPYVSNIIYVLAIWFQLINFINKKGLFYAKFFEFEEFSIVPFFVVCSIQPQHTVYLFVLQTQVKTVS